MVAVLTSVTLRDLGFPFPAIRTFKSPLQFQSDTSVKSTDRPMFVRPTFGNKSISSKEL